MKRIIIIGATSGIGLEVARCYLKDGWQVGVAGRREEELEKIRLSATALSFKTTSIILVILRKTIIFAHSDAGSTASGVSFYRSYKIIFVGGNQMRQRSFFDFRLDFRYAKIRFILLICNILHV